MSRPLRTLLRSAVAAAIIVAVAGVPGGDHASGAYRVVASGYTQWEWLPEVPSTTYQLTDVVVRPDGWLIVGTWAGSPGGIGEEPSFDGYLHLLPPWGRTPLAKTNRFGPARLGFRELEIRKGKLYGLWHDIDGEYERPERRSVGRLYELDLQTGAVLRDLGEWWWGDLAVDPLTQDLVLHDVTQREPFDRSLVRFNPDNGQKTVLVADPDKRADDPLEVTYSDPAVGDPLLFTAHASTGAIDVRLPDGKLLYTMQLPTADSIVYGRRGTCFEGLLVMTRFDGSVTAVRPAPRPTPIVLAQGGRAPAVSYAALANDGNILASRLADVTLLACPPFTPPIAPEAPPPPPKSEVALAQAAPAARAEAATRPPPPPAAPQAPPAQPPPLAGPGGPPPGYAPAVTTGLQPGIADSREEERVLGFQASIRRPEPSGDWMRLALGALLLLGMGAGAFAAVPGREPRLARFRQEAR